MLTKKRQAELTEIANKVRIDIVKMSYAAKSAHMGGSLSCVEILTYLYFQEMRLDPKNPEMPNRDRLIFSKGHDAKALYAALHNRGYFSKEILSTYEQNGGLLPGHPARKCVPGVEASTGSLGHGLSLAVGMAYAGKMNKKSHRIFTILSDGECDEGSTWEAALFAGQHNLSNLIAIIDYNKLQGFGFTKDILNLEPFAKKWESFNWKAVRVKGHSFQEIAKAVNKKDRTKPLAIIADTIKGYKGPKQHIGQISSQYKPPTEEEYNETIRHLAKI